MADEMVAWTAATLALVRGEMSAVARAEWKVARKVVVMVDWWGDRMAGD